MSVSDCIVDADLGRYEQHLLAQGFTPATRRTLLGVVDACARWQNCAPKELTGEDVAAFLSRPLAPRTRRAYLWALRSYAEWADLGPITASVRRPRNAESRAAHPWDRRGAARRFVAKLSEGYGMMSGMERWRRTHPV